MKRNFIGLAALIVFVSCATAGKAGANSGQEEALEQTATVQEAEAGETADSQPSRQENEERGTKEMAEALPGNAGGGFGLEAPAEQTADAVLEVIEVVPVEQVTEPVQKAAESPDGLFTLEEAIEQVAGGIAGVIPKQTMVAVVNFDSETPEVAGYIIDRLNDALSAKGLDPIGRRSLDFVQKELNLQMPSIDDESARSIGRLAGASSVIKGEFTKAADGYRFRVMTLTVESAAGISSMKATVRDDRALRNLIAMLKSNQSAASVGQTEGNAGVFLDKGIRLAADGEFNTAIENFTAAIEAGPNLAAAWLLRGKTLLLSISSAASIEENFEDFGVKVRSFSQEKLADAKRAVDDLTQAVRLNPVPNAYLYRGCAYLGLGEYDKAVSDYNQALKLDRNDTGAYMNRGAAYRYKGDYNRAIADYTQAVKINPALVAAYYGRGLVYADKSEYEEAIAEFNQALGLNPNLAFIYGSRGVAYGSKGDYNRAIADFTRAVKLDPGYAAAYYNRGTAYKQKGSYDQAIADFTQAVKLDPSAAAAYYNRGTAYRSRGDYSRAIADYTQAIKLKPDYAAAYNNRGIAHYYQGDYDQAIADYEKAVSIEPAYETAKNNLELAKRARGW
ncbi:MAG: tetratricopeptide repeat protein [Treponematales bacterium]